MKKILLGLALLGCTLGSTAQAADPANGKELHDNNCTHCHNTEIFSRSSRVVKDLPQLKKQVNRCQISMELQWFEEDIADVTAYLNQNFYKFAE
jgi:mono/diheme cytochrome c family protein